MTQPEEAVGGEATPAAETNAADYFTQLAEEEFGVSDQEPAEGAEETAPEEADDETAIEEEVDDLPPIDPPVSWDAEAKAKFAELPRETQEYLSKREGERERFLQQKSQEATRARQEAEQAAHQQLAQYDAQVAQQLQSYAEQLQPQRPNPALLQSDPMAFYAQQANYEAAVAQQRELQQQAQLFAQQAQARAQQIEQQHNAEQHRIIVENFPEYADPTTGPELQRKLTAVAKEMGYSDELIGQARASDILAMKQAAQWRDDALKYRALQAKKMEKVRAAKGLPKVATPGVANTPGQSAARNEAALRDVLLNSKNRDQQGAAFEALLKTKGWM